MNCGWEHTFAITDNYEVYSWGDGKYGKLGNGSITPRWEPNLVEFPQRNNYENVIEISSGFQHTIFLKGFRN